MDDHFTTSDRVPRRGGARLARLVLSLALLLASVSVASGAPLSAEPSFFTVSIAGFETTREDSQVRVTVLLRGVAITVGVGALDPVRGEVLVRSSTPCWPDHPGRCATVVREQVVGFEAFPLGTPGWAAEVGPFSYPAAGSGFACRPLAMEAQARHGGSTAADRQEPLVCG